jgi:hypothetical protein
MKRKTLVLALFAASCLLAVIGCGDDDATAPTSGFDGEGQFTLKLIDSVGPYDAVNIEFVEVSVNRAGDDSTSGWTVVNTDTLTANILEYTNGNFAMLADSSLAAGEYTQVRLLLTDNNTVVVNGETHPLVIPSGSTSGLKLNHPFIIEDGVTYAATLDFDAERSIIVTGHGTYKMNPVIRIIVDATSGSISGNIDPVDSYARITTYVGNDTISTYADTLSGDFRLMALPAGSYALEIAATAGTFRDTVLDDVQVSAGLETDIGIIVLD